MSCEFLTSSVLSQHNKNVKRGNSSQMDQHYSSVLQLSFIQKIKEIGHANPGVIQRDPGLWLHFLCIFSPPPGPSLCKLGQPGVLFVLPEVFTLVLGPSFVLFSQDFPFLVFQPLPFWTPFSYSNCLTLAKKFYIGRYISKSN